MPRNEESITMNTGLLALVSLLPVLSVALFPVILRWPASRAMPIAAFVAALIVSGMIFLIVRHGAAGKMPKAA